MGKLTIEDGPWIPLSFRGAVAVYSSQNDCVSRIPVASINKNTRYVLGEGQKATYNYKNNARVVAGAYEMYEYLASKANEDPEALALLERINNMKIADLFDETP